MDACIRNLACAILLQAAKDYCNAKPDSETRRKILKDLRSPRLKFITSDMSAIVAEQLELHADEITERLRIQNEDVI